MNLARQGKSRPMFNIRPVGPDTCRVTIFAAGHDFTVDQKFNPAVPPDYVGLPPGFSVASGRAIAFLLQHAESKQWL